MKPYNGNIFELRKQYKNLFGRDIKEIDSKFDKDEKVFKVSYRINLFPMIGEYINIDSKS